MGAPFFEPMMMVGLGGALVEDIPRDCWAGRPPAFVRSCGVVAVDVRMRVA
jgi:hypothetical protein